MEQIEYRTWAEQLRYWKEKRDIIKLEKEYWKLSLDVLKEKDRGW